MLTNSGRDLVSRLLGDPNSDGTGAYAPACWMAVSEDGTDPSDTDTSLTGEIIEGTMVRELGTYVHTNGADYYVVTRTIVADRSVTLRKAALFNAQSGGTMAHVELLNQSAVMVSGDRTQITFTINTRAPEE